MGQRGAGADARLAPEHRGVQRGRAGGEAHAGDGGVSAGEDGGAAGGELPRVDGRAEAFAEVRNLSVVHNLQVILEIPRKARRTYIRRYIRV